MTSPYSVNWIKGDKGNGINQGDNLVVNVENADYISGGIYKDRTLILAFMEMSSKVSIKTYKGYTRFFHRPKPLAKGTYVLKIRTATNGWDDEFEIY